jgi:hypothetical protein
VVYVRASRIRPFPFRKGRQFEVPEFDKCRVGAASHSRDRAGELGDLSTIAYRNAIKKAGPWLVYHRSGNRGERRRSISAPGGCRTGEYFHGKYRTGRKPIKPGADQHMVDGRTFVSPTKFATFWAGPPSVMGASLRSARLSCSPPRRAMSGCLTFPINSPLGWPAMGSLNHSTSKKTGAIVSRELHSFGSRNRTARHHPRVSNAQTNSDGMMLKISNIFG